MKALREVETMRQRWISLVVLVLLIGICVTVGAGQQRLPAAGKVVKVYDGDTITVVVAGEKFRCRLLGIDAPELSYARLWTEMDKVSKYATLDARRELHEARNVYRRWAKVTEAHGKRVRDALSALVKGKKVRLQYDGHEPAKDKYGRLLVYVSVGKMDVNAELIRRGLVVADTRFSCDRLGGYVKLWRAAQAGRVGMWGKASHEAPKAAQETADTVKTGDAPVELWGSRNSDKYHRPTCRWAKRIAPGNRVKFRSAREAKEAGYKPCRACKPPAE